MLDLHPNLIAITFVSFISLIYILNKLLYTPLLNFMDTRDLSIENDIKNASKNINDINNVQNEINDNLNEAKQEADKLKQEANKKAKEEQDKKLQALREELDSNYSQFTADLEKEKEKFRQDILSKSPILKEKFNQKFSSNRI